MEKGPTITVTFTSAEGLEAGKTKLKYKDVDVGQVTAVTVSRNLDRVVVTAELAKELKPYLVDDLRLWVVRPRIAGGSVSGLGTLLAGLVHCPRSRHLEKTTDRLCRPGRTAGDPARQAGPRIHAPQCRRRFVRRRLASPLPAAQGGRGDRQQACRGRQGDPDQDFHRPALRTICGSQHPVLECQRSRRQDRRERHQGRFQVTGIDPHRRHCLRHAR
jgi:hypothetical protein